MSRVVFKTNQYGPKVLFDTEGKIGEFKDTNSNIKGGFDDGKLRRVGDSLWIMVLEDDKKIERAKKLADYGKTFKITDQEPVMHGLGNLRSISDPNAATHQIIHEESAPKDVDKKAFFEDSKRLGFLSATILKSDGNYRQNATPELIQEYELLCDKLGLDKKDLVTSE